MKRVFLSIPIDKNLKKILKNTFYLHNKKFFKIVPLNNLHITICFFGNKTQEQIDEIIRVLDNCKNKKFSLYSVGFELFPKENPRMLWLKFQESKEFSHLVRIFSRFKDIKLKNNQKLQIPHITIARFKNQNLSKVQEIHKNNLKSFYYELKVDKIMLMESVFRKGKKNLYKVIYYNDLKNFDLKV